MWGAKRKIEENGGWEKFHAAFDEKVHAHLKEERAKKEKGGSNG